MGWKKACRKAQIDSVRFRAFDEGYLGSHFQTAKHIHRLSGALARRNEGSLGASFQGATAFDVTG
jgi:hypothetical protein